MFRLALQPAAFALVFTTVLAAAPASPALAQDPAAVGGGDYDPAFVGGNQRRAPSPPAADTGLPMPDRMRGFGGEMGGGPVPPERAAQEVEALLRLLRNEMANSGGSGRSDDQSTAIRYRNQAETLVRRHWDRLGPLTRDLYTSQYGTTDPNDASQRYRSPYGDEGQIENQLMGGVRDASQAMQNLEDLLLPMLQDLKRGFDAELRNRANSR
jgi:hypothetical protein